MRRWVSFSTVPLGLPSRFQTKATVSSLAGADKFWTCLHFFKAQGKAASEEQSRVLG